MVAFSLLPASGLAGLVVGRVGRETGCDEEPVTPPGDKEVGEVGGALSPGRTTEAAEGIAASRRLRWRRPPSDGGECGAVVTAAAPRFCGSCGFPSLVHDLRGLLNIGPQKCCSWAALATSFVFAGRVLK